MASSSVDVTCVDFDKVVIALVLEDFVVAVWNVDMFNAGQ